ncbi:glycosyltransferase family 4 protein [Actinoallomurus sp. CA-150999]|uniref:glycosyltransferase family 4 protein n=1 Tax=Actinoallomurus sp. CA-150999 TaxID=3239887 RepID=UPI003D8E34D5
MLYITYNGICNNTNGIGRQTKTLLSLLQNRYDSIVEHVGPVTFDFAFPAPNRRTLAYSQTDLEWAHDIVKSRGGRLYRLPHSESSSLWSVEAWRRLSESAARLCRKLAAQYDQTLAIAIDTPFAGVGRELQRSRIEGLDILQVFYSTDRIAGTRPTPGRLEWERDCIDNVNRSRHVRLADIGSFMTRHLREEYEADAARFMPFRSSLDLMSDDLRPMQREEALAVARRWGVPLDRPIVLSFGRADPIKGVDLLIRSLAALREDVHLVVILVPFSYSQPLLESYRKQISDLGIRATFVPRFTRELPRALSSLDETRVVVCSARGEPLSNVPFEVAMWARHGGPVVVAPAHDGFVEQIVDGHTGFLYDPGAEHALTAAIRRSLRLSKTRVAAIREAAAERVRKDRDILPNLVTSLQHLWTPVR